jgi:ABC-type lipoprotein export system ATPase subunit
MGGTPIVVTHDRRFIRPGDRIIEIQDGRIANSARDPRSGRPARDRL